LTGCLRRGFAVGGFTGGGSPTGGSQTGGFATTVSGGSSTPLRSRLAHALGPTAISRPAPTTAASRPTFPQRTRSISRASPSGRRDAMAT
jgi:hypothetical protein